jgi:hypothetical protein
MSNNTKQTSKRVATLAAEVLHDPKSSATAKTLAGSAVAQAHTTKQTSALVEHLAGQVLKSDKYSKDTKTLAASVVAQSTTDRKEK